MMGRAAEIVDRIYEAATLPEMWEGVLHDISINSGFAGGVLFTVNAHAQRGIASPGVKDVFDVFLRDGWASRSERAIRTIARNYAGFLCDSDLFTVEEESSDPLHVELMRPRGFGDVAGTVVKTPNGDWMAISFERPLLNGVTPEHVLHSFDELRPHFARAAMISGRVEIERAKTQLATLSTLGLPGAVMTATGRALAANDEFGRLSSQIELRARDIVAIRDTNAARLFSEATHTALPPRGRSIPLPRSETAPPAVLHVVPIRRNGRDLFPNANWLLVITALTGGTGLTPSILAGLFDLTPAEARVAAGLLEGLSSPAIAKRHGLSPWTVRNQLASIFAKTGVSRQSEFVALCSGVLHVP